MRKYIFALSIIMSVVILCLCGCSVLDEDYGKSVTSVSSNENAVQIKIPEIKSDDEIMPTFFDISLYDEENYADIYLGKDYKYKATYSGAVLSLPASYKSMVKNNWSLIETEKIKKDSKIMPGKSVEVQFEDSYKKQICAVFYNKTDKSKALTSCSIVKFVVKENSLYIPDSVYGQFWLNGVSNESAITDVIECLGNPSHFYAVDETNYYLDYFLNDKDKRSKVTVFIDTANDCVNRLEFSLY